MNFLPHNLYHVYNQGNNQQTLFFESVDYITFLNLVRSNIFPFSDIIAYCLMPNHFHFMLSTNEKCNSKVKQGGLLIDPVTNGFRKLLSSYSRIHNKKNDKSGSMFRQKTKAKCLSGTMETRNSLDTRDYYFKCFHYIHQNPLKAGLVTQLEDWEYSSFKDYAGLRNGTLINKRLGEIYCGYNKNTFLKESYDLADRDFLEE